MRTKQKSLELLDICRLLPFPFLFSFFLLSFLKKAADGIGRAALQEGWMKNELLVQNIEYGLCDRALLGRGRKNIFDS